MEARLYGLAAALWLALIVLLAFWTAMWAHPSIPAGYFLPNRDPASWIVPAIVVVPPLMMAGAIHVAEPVSKVLSWLAIAILALPVLSLVVLLVAAFVFSGN
jgi:hypothetical protein